MIITVTPEPTPLDLPPGRHCVTIRACDANSSLVEVTQWHVIRRLLPGQAMSVYTTGRNRIMLSCEIGVVRAEITVS